MLRVLSPPAGVARSAGGGFFPCSFGH